MVSWIFLISLLLIGLALSPLIISRKPLLLQLSYFGLVVYAAILVTAFPFATLNRWSFSAHSGVLAALAALLWVGRRFQVGAPRWARPRVKPVQGLLFTVGIALGIGLQWNGIYHVYATHDPSAYLNAALHLKATGTFLHRNELAAIAETPGNESIRSLLNQTESHEPWQLTRNYGIVPLSPREGVSSYHGFFASPLFLALGMELFGEEHGLRLHWVHFLLISVLGVAILQFWLGARSLWPWSFPLFFGLSPLVAPLFREPLSEPLACTLFLGGVLALLQWKRSRAPSDLFLFVICLALSLCVRISSVLYVPFVFAALFFATHYRRETPKARAALGIYALLSILALTVTFRLSPRYATEIFSFYTEVLTRKLPGNLQSRLLWGSMSAGLLLAFGLVLTAAGRRITAVVALPRVWRSLFALFSVGLSAALLFRYGKLVTKLDYYIGGYPFVLYNLDSLIFYASPLVAVVGLAFWYRRCQHRAHPRLFFLQSFLPFAAFFYFAFRFLPLNLQVNFQRYLIIELVPLCLIGFIVTLARTRNPALRTGLAGVTAVWCTLLTYSIHHPCMEAGSLAAYRELTRKIESLSAARPVIVGLEPSWQETAFLMPLTTGAANYPLLTIYSGFDGRASTALTRLETLGYTPVLAVAQPHGKVLRETATAGWERFAEWGNCYDYPKFDLAAPPTTLSTRCAHFGLYRRQTTALAAPKEPLLNAWHFRSTPYPLQTKHWFGFQVDGKKVCAGTPKQVVASLQFPPEPETVAPQLRVNGELQEKGVSITVSGASKHLKAHDVQIEIEPASLNCTGWNTVDISFPPLGPGMTPRKATVTSVEILPTTPRPDLLSQLSFTPNSADK